jgi:hypothetical protein
MSNTNNPNGFIPTRHLTGGTIRPSDTVYTIATAYGTSIFTGDALRLANTGLVETATASDTNLIGICGGFRYQLADGSQWFSKFWPASQVTKTGSTVEVVVYDDPNIIYTVQAYTASTNYWATTYIGNNAPLYAGVSGSTLTGQSAQQLNLDSAVATTQQFRIIGPSQITTPPAWLTPQLK